MVEITARLVKDLRDKTGAGMMDCKKALNETGGDMVAAEDWLRAKGITKAAAKADRVAAEGLIGVALDGKSGAVVEVNSETDFVAKTDEFKSFVKNLAMHIAATRPLGIGREDVSEEVVKREEDIYRAQALEMGKPEKILDKIVKKPVKESPA